MALRPEKNQDLLMWMLSTKMMPPSALIPIYINSGFGLADTRGGIITVLMR